MYNDGAVVVRNNKILFRIEDVEKRDKKKAVKSSKVEAVVWMNKVKRQNVASFQSLLHGIKIEALFREKVHFFFGIAILKLNCYFSPFPK